MTRKAIARKTKPRLGSTASNLKLQRDFCERCIDSSQTLDEIMADMQLPFKTLAGWLTQQDFRMRLHAMRRSIRRITRFQIELGALRAAEMLTRISNETAKRDAKPMTRSACVDLVRLARDSRARIDAANPSPDDVTKHRAIYHPAVPEEEAKDLIEALARADAAERQETTPSPSGRGLG